MKNSFKKLLCTVLSIMMILSLLSISAAAKPSYTYNTTKVSTNESIGFDPDLLFFEDFAPELWSEKVLADNNGLAGVTAGKANIKEAKFAGDTNWAFQNASVGDSGYLTVTQVDGSNMFFQNSDVADTYFSGKYVTEFKFKQDEIAGIGYLFKAYGMDENGTIYKHPTLQLDDSGNLLYYNGKWTTLTTIEANTWYNVKIVMDVDNEKCDVYVGTALLGENLAFGNGADWPENAKKNIYRFFEMSYDSKKHGKSTCYDDIKIYKASAQKKEWGLVPVAENMFVEDFDPELWDERVLTDGNAGAGVTAGKADVREANFAGSKNWAFLNAEVGTTGQLTLTQVDKCSVFFQNTDVTDTYFSGKYVTEFKFMQDEIAAMDCFFKAYGMSEDGATIYKHPTLLIDGSGNVCANIGGWKTFMTITPGEWYTVKLVMDVDNEMFDIYINGTLRGSNLAFSSGSAEWPEGAKKSIHRFFEIGYGNKTNGGVTHYDDIKIYRENVGRKTLWANDLTGYASNVVYNTNPLASFAGLGYNFATGGSGTTPSAMLNAANDAIEFTKGGSMSVRGFGGTLATNATMEFDFSVSGLSEGQETIAGMKDSGTYGSSVYLKGEELFVVGKDQKKYVLIYDVTPGKTYRITLHTDLTKDQDGIDGSDNGTTLGTKGVYDVYVDGVCKASGIENIGGNYQPANLPNIDRMFNVAMNADDDITISYKNLILYQDVREEVMAEAALSVGAYSNEDSIELPESISGFDGYTIAWESSDNEVLNPENGAIVKSAKEQTVTLTALVSDADREYTLVRKFDVAIPNAYDTSISYEDGSIKASVSEETAADKILLVAVYNSTGSLNQVKLITVAPENNSINIPATGLSNGNYTAKLFLWNSLTSLVPTCEAKTITFTK